jgi:hypothetical protein
LLPKATVFLVATAVNGDACLQTLTLTIRHQPT